MNPELIVFFPRNNLPKTIKNGAYEFADVWTHWVALFCRKNEILYFHSVGIKHFPKEIKNSLEKNIKANIFRVQGSNSVIFGYFCIGFTDFMLAGKKLTDFTSLFSPSDFEKSDTINLSYFKDEWNWQSKLEW